LPAKGWRPEGKKRKGGKIRTRVIPLMSVQSLLAKNHMLSEPKGAEGKRTPTPTSANEFQKLRFEKEIGLQQDEKKSLWDANKGTC